MEAEGPWYVCTWAAIALHCGGIDSAGGGWNHPPKPPTPIYKPQYTPPRRTPSVCLSPSHPQKYPQFVSNSPAISLFFFPLVILPSLLSSISQTLVARRVAFLLAGGRADFSPPLSAEFLIYFLSTNRISNCQSAHYAIRVLQKLLVEIYLTFDTRLNGKCKFCLR